MQESDIRFSDLGLGKEILEAIEKKGFLHPSPIQAGVIPLFLNGEKDIIGQAQTGTGKTASFALPILDQIDTDIQETQAIILTPTRELAIQVATEIKSFETNKNPGIALLYGGNPIPEELRALRKNPNIVVGTPGRVKHHIRKRSLKLDNLKYFVLDEADEMLNFGFREDIEDILGVTPKQRRVLLFSATLPKAILDIVHRYMGDYDSIKIKAKAMTNDNISQKFYCVHDRDKFEALCRLTEMEEDFYAIVFCRTKSDTDLVASQLALKHLHAEAIHGDIDQSQREKILRRFRSGRTNILVATDVAARGIDIENLNLVINYSLPENHEIYTHRIGRTGRAGAKGNAISLVSGKEMRKLFDFERKLGISIEKGDLPESHEIVKKKQKHLMDRLVKILKEEDVSYLEKLSKKLLKLGEPEIVMAALLKESFGDDFDQQSYQPIREDRVIMRERDGRSSGRRRSGGDNRNRAGRRAEKSFGGNSRGGNRGGKFSGKKRR